MSRVTRDYDGVPIRCENCGGWYHELTGSFCMTASDLRGSFFKLNAEYGPDGHAWYDFPHEDWLVGENVVCPGCKKSYRMTDILIQVEAFFARVCAKIIAGSSEEEGREAVTDASRLESVGGIRSGQLGSDIEVTMDAALTDEDCLKVLAMTNAGETQTAIAEACGLSTYRVRQIQNGKRVF